MATETQAPATPFAWHEVYTRDGAATRAFYTQLLGWGTESMPMSEGGTYTMFTSGGKPCGGMMEMSGPQFEGVPPHWSIYISVDDVDATVTTATGMGATVLVPAMDIPTIGRICLIQDPQGATFWVYKEEAQG